MRRNKGFSLQPLLAGYQSLSVRASLTFNSGQSFSGRPYCFSGGTLAHTAFQSGMIFMVVHMLVIQAVLFSHSLNGNLSGNGFSTHRRKDKVERRGNGEILLIR